jgi:hypothetical protein
MRIGIAYFGEFTWLYAKKILPATQTSCLKDSHTIFQINVGIGIEYF